MESPVSPTRSRTRNYHRPRDYDGFASAPVTPTPPRSPPPTSPRRASRDKTPQAQAQAQASPTRPSSSSRQHVRSNSHNHSPRGGSANREGDHHRHRPTTSRRHTTQVVPAKEPRTHRATSPAPLHEERHQTERHEKHGRHESSSRSRQRRSHSTPAPVRKDTHGHVLIPVPVRTQDSQTPLYVRAPPGQSVDFVFSPPKKKGLIERLLDNIEWDDKSPLADKPYWYHKPPTSPVSRPFYKRLLS